MISFYNPLTIIGCVLSIIICIPAFAQTEQWQDHATKNYSISTQNPTYYKKPGLYPAKKNLNNPLRHRGWHTTPDPYIEEGGVYTNKTHPAVTQYGNSLHNLSSGTPNNLVSPPSTVINPYRNGSKQQTVRITNPVPGNVAPISLPPIQP